MAKNQYYTEAELKKIFTNLRRKGLTDAMANILITHTYNRPVNTRTSGFYYPGNPDATLAWNNATRTVSLTPVDPGEPVYDPKGNLYVPNFRFYVWDREARMQRKEEVETLQLPNEEGLFLIHFGVNQDTRRYELLYIKNPEIDEIALTYIQGVPVAWIYWAYDLQQALYFGDSRHGSEWNPQMHWMLHQTLNSQRQSGLALTNVTYDGDGTSNADYQFGISAGELWHDDIFAETEAVAVGDGLPVWYFDAAGQPRFINATGKKFLNTGTGRVAHQSLTGGLAEAPDMHFVAYHLFATNCTLHPHISVIGQAAHETLGAAVGSIEAEVATLRQDLPHANLMHIGSFVLQTSDGYTNSAKAIIVYTSAAEDVFVTDTDFNTDTGILTLFRSANRPPLEQPLDIGKLVVEAINNYPETITDIVNNIATTIVQNGIASMKESYLVDPVNDTSFTQLSSWFVEAPNELMGDFRAVVVVRDKTTHTIVTLQNTLGFDYTDAANEVEDDNAIITDGSITLVLSVDATTNKLKAVLSGMTANAKRIHFCFERCANNTQAPLTLDHVSGEGTIHEPTLESEATLELEHLEGEGTVNEVTAEEGLIIEDISFGLLYNWNAITDARNIAAEGWHVSTHDDFNTLNSYAGGLTVTGGKLKEIGTDYWLSPNVGATNEFGFNGRGGGIRTSIYDDFKAEGHYLTSTSITSTICWRATMRAVNDDIQFHTCNKIWGLSVRIVKDSTTLSHGETGIYTGNDGKIYRTICIGTQEWVADNLAETKYRNGDTIPEVTDQTTWNGLTSGALCAYNNDWDNV